MTMKKKIGWRCEKCESEILRFDAIAIWNKFDQKFELDFMLDSQECCECGSVEAEEYVYD